MKTPAQTCLCVWKPLEWPRNAALWSFSKLRSVEWQQLEHISYSNRTSQALKCNLRSTPSHRKLLNTTVYASLGVENRSPTLKRVDAATQVESASPHLILIRLPNQRAWYHINMTKRFCFRRAKLALTSFLLEHFRCTLPPPGKYSLTWYIQSLCRFREWYSIDHMDKLSFKRSFIVCLHHASSRFALCGQHRPEHGKMDDRMALYREQWSISNMRKTYSELVLICFFSELYKNMVN